MKNKKSAIELSINFVVILIISIVILTLSILFLKNLFTKAYEKQLEVDYRTQEQIRAMIRDGEKVALPVTTQQIRRGDAGVFGLGILNIEETEKDFYINVEYVTGYDTNRNELFLPIGTEFQILYRDRAENLPSNSEAIIAIGISTPSSGIKSGTYIFNAVVCYDDCCYDGVSLPLYCDEDTCPGGPLTSDSNCNIPGMSNVNDLYDNIVHKLYVEVP